MADKFLRIGGRSDEGLAKAIRTDSSGNIGIKIENSNPLLDLGTYIKGIIQEIGDFKGKSVGDLSNPHIMKEAVVSGRAPFDSPAFYEVRQLDYDRLADESQRYFRQTGAVGNNIQTLFQFNIFEIAKKKNKYITENITKEEFAKVIKSITPSILGNGQGAGDGAYKHEFIVWVWNASTEQWEKFGENLTDSPVEISATITNVSDYLTGGTQGKYLYLSTTVPTADENRQSFTYINDITINVEFEGVADIAHSIGNQEDKPIANAEEKASQIAILKGILKQLQENSNYNNDNDFNINKGFDETTDSFKTKIINAVEVLQPHAFQLTENLVYIGTQKSGTKQFYKTPPKGAKGVMIEAYIDTVSGTVTDGEGLSLHVNGYIAEHSKMNLSLKTRPVKTDNKKITVIWHPDISELGDIDNSDGNIYIMPIPLTNKVYIEQNITGSFGDNEGIRASLDLEWLV